MKSPVQGSSYIDVGYGCPIELSSRHPSGSSDLLVPAQFPGSCSFQTDHQDRPWMIVDLGIVREVKRIRVFNDDGLPDRAVPLVITGTRDKQHWQPIATAQYIFGGQSSGAPFEVLFRERFGLRYLKFEVQKTSILHLDYVDIAVELPAIKFGRYLNIDVRPETIAAEYHHHESFGFSWTFTCALIAIYRARSLGIQVTRVNYSRASRSSRSIPAKIHIRCCSRRRRS